MNKRTPVIIGAVVIVVAAVLGTFLLSNAHKGSSTTGPASAAHVTTINCIGGSEKSELMADPQVRKLLREKYGLAVDYTPLGSYDQVRLSADDLKSRGTGCLWPSSASAQAVFESLHANPSATFKGYRAETVLQSPEVIYAGPEGTDALVHAGVVEQRDKKFFIVNMKSLLLDYVLKSKTWDSLGTKSLAGPVVIASTDPAKSNSGFTLSQLELNIVSTNNVYQAPNVDQAKTGLPIVRQLYDAQGLQARSSDAGFEQWLLQGGELRSPLYAGYENQVIQKVVSAHGNAAVTDQLKQNVRILYPEPTIYSDHPIMALNPDAAKFIDAMKDPQIQTIAWKTYGFRSGTQIGLNNVADFPDLPLASQLRATAPPNASVTLLLLDCIQQKKCS